MLSNQEKIQKVIEHLRDEYISKGIAGSAYEINDGCCDDFASDVCTRLKAEIPSLIDVCGESFMCGDDGAEDENDVWDQELLSRCWPKVVPPEGLSWTDMDQIGFGFHVWVACEGRHYDAECPGGVDNFFELPLFKRYIEDCIKEKQS